MAILNIPIDPTIPDHEFSISLEGVAYLLNFQLNSRSRVWHMTIKTDIGEVIVSAIPLVVNWPLKNRFKDGRLPPGEFYCVDDSGGNREPEPNSFGQTHSLVYLESTNE